MTINKYIKVHKEVNYGLEYMNNVFKCKFKCHIIQKVYICACICGERG